MSNSRDLCSGHCAGQDYGGATEGRHTFVAHGWTLRYAWKGSGGVEGMTGGTSRVAFVPL